MQNGFFDLTNFNEKSEDDLLSVSLHTEEAEFAPKSNATNDVDTHIPDANVSVPGGLKEQPTAKPEGGEHGVPVPGGLREAPTASAPGGYVKIGVPGKTTLTSDQYNSAIGALQKSFKECYDVLEVLAEATVIQKTEEEVQAEFNENAIADAILATYESGPIFEAVKRDDKDAVKDIVKDLRSKIMKDLKDDGYTFYKPNVVARVITSPIIPSHFVTVIQQMWGMRLWQVLGVALVENGNIRDTCKKLNEKYKETLGEYKVLNVQAVPTVFDLFRAKFGYKNQCSCHFLIIDKKVPSDLAKMQKEITNGVKEGEKEEGKEEKKED